MSIEHLATIHLNQPLGQLRAVPVQLRPGEPEALLLLYGADQDIDPFMGMFFFPKDTLKMALWVPGEGIRWTRELHRGVIPGVWFSPLIPFDLDQDGTEELWIVLNQDEDHPLDIKKYKLEKIDPFTGRTLEILPWKGLDFDDYTASQRYRHYLAGGYADGRPVLACIQGTYSTLQIQGLGPDGKNLWEVIIPKDAPGARGAHNCPVVDYDQDGNDELFHGERCLRFKDGSALFVGDEHMWNGHSDVIAPFRNDAQSSWNLFTARENPYVPVAPPRVVAYGPTGRRLWSDLEEGHMDMGWVGRVGPHGERVAYALKLGGKKAGPKGFERADCIEFFWNPLTGERVDLPFSAFEQIPVDLDGDGLHELVPSTGVQAGRKITDRQGHVLYELAPGTRLAHASKILDRVGEQVVAYLPDGTVFIYGIDQPASADSEAARNRFAHPFYKRNRKLTAVGYNFTNLSGL
jgi:hypothetical protein